MRRLWFPILLGVVGVAVLCALGVWQLDRMGQKDALLARIEAQINAPGQELPAGCLVAPLGQVHRYVEGGGLGAEVDVLQLRVQGREHVERRARCQRERHRV